MLAHNDVCGFGDMHSPESCLVNVTVKFYSIREAVPENRYQVNSFINTFKQNSIIPTQNKFAKF